MSDNPNLEDLLTAWHAAEERAGYWKLEELRLRNEIFKLCFPDPKLGTNKTRLPHNMALIGTYRVNYKIDTAGLLAARDTIAPEIIEATIQYKPSVRETAYRDMPVAQRRFIEPFITETPGTPALEIKPASKVRW